MKKSIKSKLYNLILYCPSDFIQKVLDSKMNQIDFYAYIYHDCDVYTKDVYVDGVIKHSHGELKVPHTHLVLMLKSWRYIKDIKSWFSYVDELGEQCSVLYREAVGTIADCLKYLDHSNAPEKYQYDKSLIVSYNIDWDDIAKYDDSDAPVDNTYDILCDMLSGEDLMTMVKKYGRDFVYHYNSFGMLAERINHRDNVSRVDSGVDYSYENDKVAQNIYNAQLHNKNMGLPYYPDVLGEELPFDII